MPAHGPSKIQQTLDIEMMLRKGCKVTAVAKWAGISSQRVSRIKARMRRAVTPVTARLTEESASRNVASVPVIIQFTPPIYAKLSELVTLVNRSSDPTDPKQTLEEYVEELVMVRLHDVGLLGKRSK